MNSKSQSIYNNHKPDLCDFTDRVLGLGCWAGLIWDAKMLTKIRDGKF